MADRLVHFVGRRRGNSPLPIQVAQFTAEQRLANILNTGCLYGFPVYRSGQVPVICTSDLSAAEAESAFSRGLNSRGFLEPWAVVLDRTPAWEFGFRPVAYADADRFEAHRAALAQIYGPGWEALAVRTKPGADDWTAEREWRYCFGPQAPPAIDIRLAVRAVIVGRSGWVPRPLSNAPTLTSPFRWVWDAAAGHLVNDGRLPLW